jgi:hypothetical protein
MAGKPAARGAPDGRLGQGFFGVNTLAIPELTMDAPALARTWLRPDFETRAWRGPRFVRQTREALLKPRESREFDKIRSNFGIHDYTLFRGHRN